MDDAIQRDDAILRDEDRRLNLEQQKTRAKELRRAIAAGEADVETENPLGAMGYYLVSKGDLGPFRTKIRSASFSNVSIVPWLLKGVYVPDIITILASLYFILGDIDR